MAARPLPRRVGVARAWVRSTTEAWYPPEMCAVVFVRDRKRHAIASLNTGSLCCSEWILRNRTTESCAYISRSVYSYLVRWCLRWGIWESGSSDQSCFVPTQASFFATLSHFPGAQQDRLATLSTPLPYPTEGRAYSTDCAESTRVAAGIDRASSRIHLADAWPRVPSLTHQGR